MDWTATLLQAIREEPSLAAAEARVRALKALVGHPPPAPPQQAQRALAQRVETPDLLRHAAMTKALPPVAAPVAIKLYRGDMAPAKAGKHWTTPEALEAATLLDTGMSYADVAARVGRTPGSVRAAMGAGLLPCRVHKLDPARQEKSRRAAAKRSSKREEG